MNQFHCDCGSFTRKCDAVLHVTVQGASVLLKIERLASGSTVTVKKSKQEFLNEAWTHYENPWSDFWLTDRALNSDHVSLDKGDWNKILKLLEA